MKKIVLIITLMGVFATAGVTAFGVAKASASKSAFENDGYVLLGNESGDGKNIEVGAGTSYTPTVAGTISFTGTDGSAASAPLESFVTYNDDSIAAFADGIILDFNDLTGNFINNYCIPAGMKITRNGSDYYANSGDGDIVFGDHIWKLTDNKYLVCSPMLDIHFADDDIRTAENYVQVCVSEDGIVRLLTPDNLWTTLTSDCYISTQSGVTVTPVTQSIEDNTYKLSLASMSVSADDNIVLTEDEVRRQIVPKITIDTIDGTDGDAGDDGISGEAGEDGDRGTDGKAGVNGKDGENGNDGSRGTSGSSGSSGTGGTSGTNGQNGAAGSQGEGSQSDAAIAVKYNGINGSDGLGGNAGAGGEDGTNGDSGDTGLKGDSGKDGESGDNGSTGEDGDPGSKGDDGESGSGGSSGDPGGQGKDGRDADTTTGLKSQIPVITITGWEVYSTGVRGAITIQDPNEPEGFFAGVEGENDHPAYITVTNKETGEVIYTYNYHTDSGYTPAGRGSENFFDEINDPNGSDGKTVYFSMDPEETDRLLPDTEYILQVTAYYAVNGMYYYRNFVSRSFYTDSTGICLALEDLDIRLATDNTTQYASSVVGITRADSESSAVTMAEVYLLTEEQNRQFSVTKTDNYVYKYKISYGSTTTYNGYAKQKGQQTEQQTAEDPSSITLDFVPTTGIRTKEGESPSDLGGLDSNTTYIARVIVTTDFAGTSGTALSPQQLEVSTLRLSPTWTEGAVPEVSWNRQTGSFEVSRPAVTDPDGAVKSYTYIPWQLVDGSWVKMTDKARTVVPGTPDPVTFDLPTTYQSGDTTLSYEYKFEVDINANDNEKDVTFVIGFSEEISTNGATLPAFSFTASAQEFNYVKGSLYVSADAATRMIVDEVHPLTLAIYGDEYYENTIVLKKLPNAEETICGIRSGTDYICEHADVSGNCACENCSRDCDCSCDWWVSGAASNPAQGVACSEFTLNIALDELYRDQKYRVVVTGTLILGKDSEGNDIYSDRELGVFTFRTSKIGGISTNWEELSTGSDPLNVKLIMEGTDTAETNEFRKGQVTLNLYEGKGESKELLKTKMLNKTEDLAKIFGEGLEIKQTTFDMDKLSQGKEYTIEVSCVQDKTYAYKDDKYEYDNRTSVIANNSKIVQAKKAPPDLTSDPHKAVTATPIYNKYAGSYGESVREDLDDYAVIGYMLQANYDNVSELGYKVRYYAFEFTDFWNAVEQNIDPVGNYLTDGGQDLYEQGEQVGINKLGMWTREFQTTDSKPPKVLVLFGNETTTDENASTSAGYAKYYIAPLTETGGVKTGMSRGYRFIFAYTVEYNNGTSKAVYPYGEKDSKEFKQAVEKYGIGQMLLNNRGTRRGTGKAYVLNSGIQEAPKSDPEFRTYLAYVQDVSLEKINPDLSTLTNYATLGSACLRYYYIDADSTIDREEVQNISYEYYEIKEKKTVKKTGTAALAGAEDQKKWLDLNLSYLRELGAAEGIIPKVKIVRYLLDYNESILGAATSEHSDRWGLVEDPVEMDMGSFYPDYDWNGIIDINNNELNPSEKIPQVSMNIDNNTNRITFYFDLGDALNTLPKKIMERSFMARVTAEDGDGNTQTFTLPLQEAEESEGDSVVVKCCAVLSTSRLGEGGSGTGDFTFSVDIIYDNGYQGWDLLKPDAKNADETEDVYAENGFGLWYYDKLVSGALSGREYFTKYNTPAEKAYAGLFKPSGKAVDFSANLADEPARIKTEYPYWGDNKKNVFSRRLYVMEKGVDFAQESEAVGVTDSSILVPKYAGIRDCYFEDGSGTGTGMVTVILPVVCWQNYSSLSNSIALFVEGDESGTTLPFSVSGLATARKYEKKDANDVIRNEEELTDEYYVLYAQLFEYSDEGHKAAKQDSSIPSGQHRIAIILNSDGTVYGTMTFEDDDPDPLNPTSVTRTFYDSEEKEWKNLPEVGDGALELSKYYVLSLFMELEDNQMHVLMRSDSEASDIKATYDVNTSEEVSIDLQGLDYDKENISYFTKALKFTFNIAPRAYGLKMRYEIYESEEDAQLGLDGGAVPYINLNEDPGKRYVDASYLKTTGNKVTVDLGTARLQEEEATFMERMPNLVPGKTYWLRLAAYNKLDEQQGEAVIRNFTVPYTKITSGIVSGQYRSQNEVSFKVTVRDIRHLSMGYHYDKTDGTTIDLDEGSSTRKYNDEGLYAVRFTDADGKRFYTVYDDYVYSYADLSREFVLNYGVQKTGQQRELNPDKAYYCHIYLVKDLDLDGLSGSADNTDDTKQENWRYFFNDPDDSAKRLKIVKNAYTVKGKTYDGFKLTGGFNELLNTLWTDIGDRKAGSASLDPDGTCAKLETQFLQSKIMKKTMPADGYISIDETNTSFSAKTASFQFYASETAGVVTLDSEQNQIQGFDTIEYTIIREDNGQIYSDTLRKGTDDASMMQGEVKSGALTGVCTLEMPLGEDETVEKGVYYQISLKLKKNASGDIPEQEFTFSARFIQN